MQLTKENIKKIADLARLELTEDELDKYGQQLSGVLNYIDQLQAVDTQDVDPTAQVTGLIDVLREDEAMPWDKDDVEAALSQSPEFEDHQTKVRRILDNSN